jgi:hypothetical protein
MTAILYFYRSLGLYTGLISLVLWRLAEFPLHQNFLLFIPRYIILKLITDLIVWRYMRKYRPSQRFFYHNLSISESRLYITVFTIDVAVFFAVVAAIKIYSES